jgi:tetratricopeptide (TPR) repeat protein
MVYHELGRCLYFLWKYEDAQVALFTALNIETNTLGRDHPNTAWTLSYLSDCYQASRNYEKALCLLQETLKIRKNKYGDNHEKTLSTLRRMGELYNKWGKYEKAEECLREALGIAEAASLTGHVDLLSFSKVAYVYHELGRCLYYQRKYENAQVALCTALDIETNTLGRQHPRKGPP